MKRICLVLLLSLLSLNLFCQVHWTKYPDNPVMFAGTSGDWDKNQVFPTTVLYQDSMYHMWYWSGDINVHRFQIGHASSPDGINWTKDILYNPVLKQGPSGAWDDNALATPSVLFRDSSYHMWYSASMLTNGVTIMRIGHATSTDGSNWTKDSLNPVLDLGPAGSWDGAIVGDVTVVHDGIEYHMWYLGGSGNGMYHLGHATSNDGSNWTKDSLNPVLMKGESWEGRGLEWPMVVYDDSVFHLWYSGGGIRKWLVGYATSLDGINWIKDIRNPIFKGTPGTWNEKYIAGTAIIDSAHIKYKMWYGGITSGLGYADIGYAESDTRVPFLFVNSRSCLGTRDTVLAKIDLDGVIYIVPDSTTLLMDSINTHMVASEDAMAESEIHLPYAGISPGRYNVVAVSNAGFVSTNPILLRVVENLNPPILGFENDTVYRGDTLFVTSDKDVILYILVNGSVPEDSTSRRLTAKLELASNNPLGIPTDKLGVMTYVIYARDDCGIVSEAYQVRIELEGTGIVNQSTRGIKIFPNPATDLLTVQTHQEVRSLVEISSINGQLVYSGMMDGSTHQIDLSSLRKGVYFISIRSEDFVATRKIIKL